ncbi:hypothetical protein NE237_028182 [Protea cynaroides]|uniref:Leucine-rich repeat-containing N-terminal plant-type domain-containing protein n=1 Tax=Protea cynaroides TaxID=273540 RepID=A0A9Q0JUW4_9MAGN|nr:hypothetical protein NE237_028182 [Protea cynaroides]
MGWVLLKVIWVSLVPLLQIRRSFGCLKEERIALLEFKASINCTDFNYEDGSGLPSWVDDRGRDDCCVWERVLCNHTNGRVINLSLDDIRGDCSSIWYLNVTLLSTFEDLQQLNLSSNSLDGWIKNECFERFAGLRKLEVLDLTYNHFKNSILPSLGALTSLRTLSVASNNFKGSHHFEELGNLHSMVTGSD